jgi:anthranilate synthase
MILPGTGFSTEGQGRGAEEPFRPSTVIPPHGDHRAGEYARAGRQGEGEFSARRPLRSRAGPEILRALRIKPSEITRRLKAINPSPYSFFINLGNQEYLVGASPEMFVRVSGRRIETCPISGTIKRGDDAISDSANRS